MSDVINNYKNARSNWVASVRERFSCDNEESQLKIWELWVLILCIFSKEILDFLVYTIYPSKISWVKLFSATFPLNLDIFWTLLLKLGIGYIFLLYLNIRHRGTKTIWRIWAFWGLTTFFPFINSLDSSYEIMRGMSSLLALAIYGLFFVYFFVIDPTHADSFKMLIYDDLTIDETTGRVYRNPNSRISRSKLVHLGITTASLIASAFILVAVVLKIIEMFQTKSTTSGSSIKPKNQEKLENLSKTNPLTVIISSILIAPILEEWIYRRFILKEGKWKWWTIPLSGFIFGLVHLSEAEGIMYIIPYVLPGLIFALAMYISKNIWHSIIAHALFNTLVLIRVFYIG